MCVYVRFLTFGFETSVDLYSMLVYVTWLIGALVVTKLCAGRFVQVIFSFTFSKYE